MTALTIEELQAWVERTTRRMAAARRKKSAGVVPALRCARNPIPWRSSCSTSWP